MKHFAILALALAASTASAQPLQQSEGAITAELATYGSVTINDTVTCPRSQPGYTTSYDFPIRFQQPFANDRYAVMIGQSGALVQAGQSLTYTTAITGKAREGMTINVTLRCTAGSRTLTLSYTAIGRS